MNLGFIKGGGLSQGTNLLGGGVRTLHAGTTAVWGHAPQEISEK